MKKFLTCAILLIAIVMGGSGLTSCSSESDNPVQPEVTLEDALKDGTIVAMAFNLNGEDFYVAFVRVGDTYELLDFDKALTRGEEPTITEKECDFKMVHDKANNVINFTVKEKTTSGLVLTAIIDINTSTMEVIPGDPKYKITSAEGERRRRYPDRRTRERSKGGDCIQVGRYLNDLHFHQRRWKVLLRPLRSHY